MRDWIWLDPKSLNRARACSTGKSGVTVHVSLSPYDVPEAVRGFYDGDATKQFIIEFRYMGDGEELTPIAHEEHVTLMVGRNSGRLYQIRLNTAELQPSIVELQLHQRRWMSEIDDALNVLIREPPRQPRTGNYRLARKVLTSNGQQLFAGMASQAA